MEKFRREVFRGQERAHGCYIKGDINEKGKQTGGVSYCWVVSTTRLVYGEERVAGVNGLGIIPINDDNECQWGCIDVDQYPLDHKKIVDQIRKEEVSGFNCVSIKKWGCTYF